MARPRGGDWLADEMYSLRAIAADLVVCLLTDVERNDLGLADESQAAEYAGLRFKAFPIVDRLTPELGPFLRLIEDLVEQLALGSHIVVHCRMGIGRASMVAAAVLMAQGNPTDQSWAAVQAARGLDVPDTPDQRVWVDAAMASD